MCEGLARKNDTIQEWWAFLRQARSRDAPAKSRCVRTPLLDTRNDGMTIRTELAVCIRLMAWGPATCSSTHDHLFRKVPSISLLRNQSTSHETRLWMPAEPSTERTRAREPYRRTTAAFRV
jgi:hypothetical protein